MHLFGNVLLVVFTVMHIYVFWRATTVPFLRRHLRRRIILGLGLLLWAACMLGRRLGHGSDGWAAGTAELLSISWMATILLVFISMLAADLVTGFGLWLRRLAPSLRGWALCAGGLLAVIALVQGLRAPVVMRYEVHLAGLPAELDGTTLAGMADLHLGSRLGERWLAARVAQVQALRPDVVVLLGDVFDGHGQPTEEVLRGLESLSAPMGVWAVPGNHESFGRRRGARELDEDASINVLRTSWAQLRPGLVLAGVEDLSPTRGDARAGVEINKALAGRPEGATILLSHIPWGTQAAADAGVGLMLCGHTHGGQIWPLGYLSRLRYPMVGGRYQVGDMTAIVCRGTGLWGPRMRLWRPGEIIHVTLRRAAS